MPSKISGVTFDCADPYALSLFWTQVTGWTEESDDPNFPDDEFCYIEGALGIGLGFQRVPEPKSVKNRTHLDIAPEDRTRDEEVERLLAIGATQLGDFREDGGAGWVVLADPEGNEFCVVRSDAERQ